jgi:hypothetical protein
MANQIPSMEFLNEVEQSTGFVYPEKFKNKEELGALFGILKNNDDTGFFIPNMFSSQA